MKSAFPLPRLELGQGERTRQGVHTIMPPRSAMISAVPGRAIGGAQRKSRQAFIIVWIIGHGLELSSTWDSDAHVHAVHIIEHE